MNFKHMRTGLLFAAVLAPSACLLAQMGSTPNNQPTLPNQPNQPNNGMGGAAGMAGAMSGGNTTMDPEAQMAKDKMFLHAAAEGGLAEVQLGKLAAQKGGDDVKQFGQKMVDDHTALNNDLKPFADEMGVRVPAKLSKDDQAEYDKLSALSGDDFDKEYLAYMVKDHHKDLREFRMESMATQDASLKAAVTKGAAVIREHTMMVDKLARSKGLVVPGRGPAPVAAPAPPPSL